MSASARIGVFDSGLGGLTVVREILRQLPRESVHYFADTAHVPYGPRSREEILRFAGGIVHYFRRSGAKAVVAACNLSSAVALEQVAREVSFPLLGMIRPGARAALDACRDDRIGVLATEGTVKSQAYPEALHRLAPQLAVYQVACPSFVPLVEAGEAESREALRAAREYTAPLREAGVRTVVLGCTHYPYLARVLRRALPRDSILVDPAQAVVAQLTQVLEERDLLWSGEPTPHRFEASADPDRLAAGVRKWLALKASATLSDLWDEQPADTKLAHASH